MGLYEVPLSVSLLGFGIGTMLANFHVVSLYVLCCSVNVLFCVACLTVFVNCLVKQFAMCVGVVAILLLNVMDVFSVCGGALLDRPCMVFQRVCVLCL